MSQTGLAGYHFADLQQKETLGSNHFYLIPIIFSDRLLFLSKAFYEK